MIYQGLLARLHKLDTSLVKQWQEWFAQRGRKNPHKRFRKSDHLTQTETPMVRCLGKLTKTTKLKDGPFFNSEYPIVTIKDIYIYFCSLIPLINSW